MREEKSLVLLIEISFDNGVYETVSILFIQLEIVFENVVDSPSLKPSDLPLYDVGFYALIVGYVWFTSLVPLAWSKSEDSFNSPVVPKEFIACTATERDPSRLETSIGIIAL